MWNEKILSILLSVALLFTSIGYAKAAEKNQTGAVCSEATYGGYDLSWTNNGERDILLSATNGVAQFPFNMTKESYAPQRQTRQVTLHILRMMIIAI